MLFHLTIFTEVSPINWKPCPYHFFEMPFIMPWYGSGNFWITSSNAARGLKMSPAFGYYEHLLMACQLQLYCKKESSCNLLVLWTTVATLVCVCFRYTVNGECWPQHQRLPIFPLHSSDFLVSLLASMPIFMTFWPNFSISHSRWTGNAITSCRW